MNGKAMAMGFMGLLLTLGVFMGPVTAQMPTQIGSWQLHCVLAIGFDVVGGNPESATNVHVKVIWSQMKMKGIALEIHSIHVDEMSGRKTIVIGGTFTFSMQMEDMSTMVCDGRFMLTFLLHGRTHPGTGVFVYNDQMHRGYFVGNLESDGAYHVTGLLNVFMKQ